MRVLVIEDERVLREQIHDYLAGLGFAVDSASTGAEGEYMIKEYTLDVVILDLGLPDFSGIELITRIRKANIKVPILILTARSRWQDKVAGLFVCLF